MKYIIPADVPPSMHKTYQENYEAITLNSGRLILFTCDHKLEHLNDDFFGPEIHPDANNPEHIFTIASHGKIGALATQLGLIARYGAQYKNINYSIKLNDKTDLIPTQQRDPQPALLTSIDDVIQFKKSSGLAIRAVGYTIYLGSEYEADMLHEASNIIFQAHQHGLIATLWVYIRGKAIEQNHSLLATGAAGMATALGADFVKIKTPRTEQEKINAQLLAIAAQAAGNTGVLCAGGSKKTAEQLLCELYDQITIGNAAGCAIGRNIFQRSVREATALTHAIAAIVIDKKTVDQALLIYSNNIKP